jgi:hypothetical protein
MIWHILKKDLRLLWVFALLAAAIHLAAAGLRAWLGPFLEPNQLVVIADLLSLLSILSIVILCLAVMQQDAVPGARQDWLTRPIKRGDLVLAKLLFVMLIVQGPLLLADVGEGLASGFAFPVSVSAAGARNVAMLCYLSLPAVMIGAVTRSVMESFVAAMSGLIIYLAVFLVGVVMLLGVKTSLGATGLSWMIAATWYTLTLGGTAVVVSIQFYWRKTTMARCLIGAGGAVILLSAFLPWRTAFALQEDLAKQPASGRAIVLAFDPQLGAFKQSRAAVVPISGELHLPVRVTGVPPAAVMLMDRADILITGIGGRTLYRGRSNLSVDGAGSIQDARLEVRQSADSDSAVEMHQRIFIPAAVFTKYQDQLVRISIDYSLTLLRADATYAIAAVDDHERLGDLGWCSTRVDGDGDSVQLRCLYTGRVPSCLSASLEHVPSGSRNPEIHDCEPDYTAFETKLWPDVLSRLGAEIPFYDRSGLTHYPVDGPKLAHSRLVITTYDPRDHFTRHLDVPTLRLSDLAAYAVSGPRP